MTDQQLVEVLERDVVSGAQALIGATLVRGELSARIVETEAYRPDDPAAHSFGKSAMKNMAMFGDPGTAYIYKCYGCHWMLNVVAGIPGYPCAVLIRAGEPLTGLEVMRERRGTGVDRALLSGPGKLAAAFDIDQRENGATLIGDGGRDLRIVARPGEEPRVIATRRIGIAHGKWHEVLWRFVDADRAEWTSVRLNS